MVRKIIVIIVIVLVVCCAGITIAQDKPPALLYALTGDDNVARIYTVDVVSAAVTELAALTGDGKDAGWSPDGRYVFLISRTDAGTRALTLVDRTDASTRQLTDDLLPDNCDVPLWWSPDSRYLAYLTGTPEKPLMKLFDTQIGGIEILPAPVDGAPINGAPWSPDSRYFVYTSHETDPSPRRVVWDTALRSVVAMVPAVNRSFMYWLPDNRLLYPGAADIEQINPADGSTQHYPGTYIMSVSPDGRYFISASSDNNEAYMLVDRRDGSSAPMDEHIYEGRWSSDGRYILYGADNTSLYDTTDGSTRVLVNVRLDVYTAQWLPGTHVVAFRRDPQQTNRVGLWIFDLDADSFRRYDKTPVMDPHDPAVNWSPDGAYLTVQAADGLHLFERSTQSLITIDGTANHQILSPRWSPDSRYLAFTMWTNADDEMIHVVNTTDGTLHPLDTGEGDDTGSSHIHLFGWMGGSSRNSLMFCGEG